MVQIILYSEVDILCILILLLLCSKVRGSMFLQSQRYLFRMVTLANVALAAMDLLWVLGSGGLLLFAPVHLRGLNVLYYFAAGLSCYLWFLYSENVQESRVTRSNRNMLLAALPLLVFCALVFFSPETGWIFFVDSAGGYHRGEFYFLAFLITYGYLFATAGNALRRSRRTPSYQARSRYRTLAVFILPPVVTGAIQFFLPRLPVICIGATLSMLNVYISLQEQLISVDPLTRLNNRNQLRQHLYSRLSHPGKRPLYLLMMDGDQFKHINDQYGHIEGDHALQEIAQALIRACTGRHDFIARYGGDEFIILHEAEDEESVEELCRRVHAEMARADTRYPLSVSIGCARYTPDLETGQQWIERADAELYRVKQEKKAYLTSN